jgi:AcrR family transcriptional regulator
MEKKQLTPKPGDRLLNTATRLFCRHGINATGIDKILAEAGVAKMTLYNQFGSKEGLVFAVLEREGEAWRSWFQTAVDQLGGTPADKLVGIFDVLENWFQQDGFYGCAFINAVAEHNKEDPRIRSLAQAHKKKVLAVIQSGRAGRRERSGSGNGVDRHPGGRYHHRGGDHRHVRARAARRGRRPHDPGVAASSFPASRAAARREPRSRGVTTSVISGLDSDIS